MRRSLRVAVREKSPSLHAAFRQRRALTRPSQATTTVFDNYTGNNCDCGTVGPALIAAGFMLPFGAVDSFAGAAAFVQQSFISENAPQPFSMALYSSTSKGVRLFPALDKRNIIHVRVTGQRGAYRSNLYWPVDFITGGKRNISWRSTSRRQSVGSTKARTQPRFIRPMTGYHGRVQSPPMRNSRSMGTLRRPLSPSHRPGR